MWNRWLFFSSGLILVFACCGPGLSGTPIASSSLPFVQVSPKNNHYLALSNGEPFIPIGLNLVAPDTSVSEESAGMLQFEQWMDKLSRNGGNYIRIWLSSPFWDVEHETSGVFDEVKARRIDTMLKLARQRGIRVKMTLEHFRTLEGEGRQRWAYKPLHHLSRGGPAQSMADFFDGATSREQFRHKLEWYAKRYRNDPVVYGWELWNEINATAGGDHLSWSEVMLRELHRLFPLNLSMQSLGSFDTPAVRDLYQRMSLLPGNDVAQVHRYLDLGAQWEVCHGPVDVLAAEAVRELLAWDPLKPVILAESGAVEPNHAGPFRLYWKDKEGILLHDLLFAPFFSGAAGPGQIWHWNVYVDRNNLWHHFERFAEAIKRIDPAAENLVPMMVPHPRLRIYVLKGTKIRLAWCRDTQNDWKSELEQGKPTGIIENSRLDFAQVLGGLPVRRIQYYDPWRGIWHDGKAEGEVISLPPFSRSMVVRVEME
jgi:hypothetical protein